ncbi:ras-like protein family member 10A isoform X3 [Leopardus geoffroyi]|uniref:ras-like protein family member 10A isoform X3 n=1 Tax=Leopardus geoffroyi TaxID=46844 RepID=UPI001E262A45|nr:ras-like protein family member 10A isoform X3 [Leopardus geoffroyi]
MGGSLRVAVLGAPGVGKTAIIRQFLFGDYPERHRPTDGPRLYRPAVLLDGAVYDLSIRDGDGAPPSQNPGGPELPKIRPGDFETHEWPDPKDWSLQDTDAFVLVYDICSPDSFDYVKALRQRISETRFSLTGHLKEQLSGGSGRTPRRQSSNCGTEAEKDDCL